MIAAGKSGTASQTRLELARENTAIIRRIAATLSGYSGLVILVTNPVDVLTFEFVKASGLPVERVLGPAPCWTRRGCVTWSGAR